MRTVGTPPSLFRTSRGERQRLAPSSAGDVGPQMFNYMAFVQRFTRIRGHHHRRRKWADATVNDQPPSSTEDGGDEEDPNATADRRCNAGAPFGPPTAPQRMSKKIRDTVAADGHPRSSPGRSLKQSGGHQRTICAACGRHEDQSSAFSRGSFHLWKRLLEAERNVIWTLPFY